MPDNREDLPSIGYWAQSHAQIAQRSYVAFCLFTLGVQDGLLGMLEKERRNLNWSATCSYYALVHIGRMFGFLALGDFPRSHADLRNLFDSGATNNVCLNWTSEFLPMDTSQSRSRSNRSEHRYNPSILRSIMTQYWQSIGISSAEDKFGDFGRLLSSAAKLRNESNYEALLIAHEYNHDFVTSTFEKLADTMCRATDKSVLFAAQAFRAFVENDRDLVSDRTGYQAFFTHYLQNRFMAGIRSKVGDLQFLIEKAIHLVNSIAPDEPAVDFSRIEEEVSMEFFSPKSGLMKDFRSKIERFENTLAEWDRILRQQQANALDTSI